MKRLFSLWLVLLLGYFSVHGQQNGIFRERFGEKRSATERAERQTQILTDSLNLSEDQIIVVNEINLKYAKQREALIKAESSMQEKMYDIETLEIKQGKELKKVLDKEQYKKYKVMQERMREKRGKMMQRQMRNRQGN